MFSATVLAALAALSLAQAELALTPFGLLPDACVHPYDGDVVSAESLSREHPECSPATKALPNGWTAYAVWESSKPVTKYIGNFTVPPVPGDAQGQTLFLFTGLQNAMVSEDPSAPVTIIQPVLQWGPSAAGGGQYWAIASWFVGGPSTVYSKLVTVQPGETIFGNMTETGKSWVVDAYVPGANPTHSAINANVGTGEFFAFVTLEVYNIQTCGDFSRGQSLFTGLTLNDGALTPQWKNQTQAQCAEAIKIVSPKEVIVKF